MPAAIAPPPMTSPATAAPTTTFQRPPDATGAGLDDVNGAFVMPAAGGVRAPP
jgi:hypothetical protein